jgi:uncharacterized protein
MDFHVYKDAKQEWRWQLKSINGKIVADSAESYHNRGDCLHELLLIKREAAAAKVSDVSQDPPLHIPT